MQEILNVKEYLARTTGAYTCIFLVCGQSFCESDLYRRLHENWRQGGIRIVQYSAFAPNPEMSSIRDGVELFQSSGCDAILAAGGGSAIDVAKCVKYYACLVTTQACTQRELNINQVPLDAIPTTAGSGSEATHFAVVYEGTEKKSISAEACRPRFAVLEPSLLKTLPPYQKSVTMLDAFCHAIESYWSIHATVESKNYSIQAIRKIIAAKDCYLGNDDSTFKQMMCAAHLAGKAIDIAQTTAAHAMSYKLTKEYGIAHGHAVSLCLPEVWRATWHHLDQCTYAGGAAYLEDTMNELRAVMGCTEDKDVPDLLGDWATQMGLEAPTVSMEEDVDRLVQAINPDRLKNHPVRFTTEQLKQMYKTILRKTDEYIL